MWFIRKRFGCSVNARREPLAFTSKQSCPRNLGISTYDTWLIYLIGQDFKIKMDHHILKYFLEYRLSSPEKHKWITKMIGYNYEIIHMKEKNNLVAISLYIKYENEGYIFSLSLLVPDWLTKSWQEWLELTQWLS